jgi:pilus assembly protein FimV
VTQSGVPGGNDFAGLAAAGAAAGAPGAAGVPGAPGTPGAGGVPGAGGFAAALSFFFLSSVSSAWMRCSIASSFFTTSSLGAPDGALGGAAAAGDVDAGDVDEGDADVG